MKRETLFFKGFVFVCSVIFVTAIILTDIVMVKSAFAAQTFPAPTALLSASAEYKAAQLLGIKLDPTDPLKLEFLVDRGDNLNVSKEELMRMTNYFLAALTTPKEKLWVNLSPFEAQRIIEGDINKTDIADVLLTQDYLLKQLASSLTHPDTPIGKAYWGMENRESRIENTNAFTKIWISPDKAEVYEHDNGRVVLITESSMKVQTEADYLAMQKSNGPLSENKVETIALLSEITDQVNKGKHFAQLRQMYNTIILAEWFKNSFSNSLYKNYINKGKIAGIAIDNNTTKDEVYNLYCQSFEKGVFNYIKKERTPDSRLQKRQYFSGGISSSVEVSKTENNIQGQNVAEKVDDTLVVTLKRKDNGRATVYGRNYINSDGTVEEIPAIASDSYFPPNQENGSSKLELTRLTRSYRAADTVEQGLAEVVNYVVKNPEYVKLYPEFLDSIPEDDLSKTEYRLMTKILLQMAAANVKDTNKYMMKLMDNAPDVAIDILDKLFLDLYALDPSMTYIRKVEFGALLNAKNIYRVLYDIDIESYVKKHNEKYASKHFKASLEAVNYDYKLLFQKDEQKFGFFRKLSLMVRTPDTRYSDNRYEFILSSDEYEDVNDVRDRFGYYDVPGHMTGGLAGRRFTCRINIAKYKDETVRDVFTKILQDMILSVGEVSYHEIRNIIDQVTPTLIDKIVSSSTSSSLKNLNATELGEKQIKIIIEQINQLRMTEGFVVELRDYLLRVKKYNSMDIAKKFIEELMTAMFEARIAENYMYYNVVTGLESSIKGIAKERGDLVLTLYLDNEQNKGENRKKKIINWTTDKVMRDDIVNKIYKELKEKNDIATVIGKNLVDKDGITIGEIPEIASDLYFPVSTSSTISNNFVAKVGKNIRAVLESAKSTFNIFYPATATNDSSLNLLSTMVENSINTKSLLSAAVFEQMVSLFVKFDENTYVKFEDILVEYFNYVKDGYLKNGDVKELHSLDQIITVLADIVEKNDYDVSRKMRNIVVDYLCLEATTINITSAMWGIIARSVNFKSDASISRSNELSIVERLLTQMAVELKSVDTASESIPLLVPRSIDFLTDVLYKDNLDELENMLEHSKYLLPKGHIALGEKFLKSFFFYVYSSNQQMSKDQLKFKDLMQKVNAPYENYGSLVSSSTLKMKTSGGIDLMNVKVQGSANPLFDGYQIDSPEIFDLLCAEFVSFSPVKNPDLLLK